MAQLPWSGGFNAANVDPSQSFDPIPAGKYPMTFTESEMKDTKSSDGQYLQLVAEVLDGELKGRKIWVRLNLINRNPTAVEIAQRELSAICHATGVMNPKDSVQLHGKPFLGKVKLIPPKDGYEAKNEMSGYEALAGATPVAAQAQAPAQATQPASTATQYAAASGAAQQPAAPQTTPAAEPADSGPPWLRNKAG